MSVTALVSGCHCMRPSICMCLSWRASVCLSLWVSAPPLRVFRSCLSLRVYPSVGVCHRRPSGPRGLWVWAPREGGRGRGGQPGEAGRGEGGDCGRGRAGAPSGPEGVCAGGRRRRLSESAQPALGNIGRLQLPARPGPARLGSATSGEYPAPPGTLRRPAAHSASWGRCAPRGTQALKRDAHRTPGPAQRRPPPPHTHP